MGYPGIRLYYGLLLFGLIVHSDVYCLSDVVVYDYCGHTSLFMRGCLWAVHSQMVSITQFCAGLCTEAVMF